MVASIMNFPIVYPMAKLLCGAKVLRVGKITLNYSCKKRKDEKIKVVLHAPTGMEDCSPLQ